LLGPFGRGLWLEVGPIRWEPLVERVSGVALLD
jgi:hypothetical protein